MFGRFELFELGLGVEEGVWVLAGISTTVGLRSKCTLFGVESDCPVCCKIVTSCVQSAPNEEQSKSKPRMK